MFKGIGCIIPVRVLPDLVSKLQFIVFMLGFGDYFPQELLVCYKLVLDLIFS